MVTSAACSEVRRLPLGHRRIDVMARARKLKLWQ
jgi:hypothetical protein